MRFLKMLLAVAFVTVPAALSCSQANASDADYIALALSAAPAAVASGAAVVRTEKDGSVTTLRKGSNGFTCMTLGPSPMCLDANSMAFIDALMKHAAPPDKVGIGYMLQGDSGASNTDAYARAKTADNHWVVTGPHIMIFGPPSKALGYPTTKDADPTKPYMMWAGTPYEHAMVPIGPAK
jgi:hypothetical protein